jgi:hypothetical protein
MTESNMRPVLTVLTLTSTSESEKEKIMRKTKWYLAVGVIILQCFAYADDSAPMEKVLNLYARIHADLVSGSLGQVKDHASFLLVAARGLSDKKLSHDMELAAQRMVTDSSSGMGQPSASDARNDFKKLSNLIIEWVKKEKPVGWSVIHCSKLDVSWVQEKNQEIQNPYSGKEMQSCGKKVK